MGTRIELQTILETILGTRNVYFQAPSSLSYPCIIYSRDNYNSVYADNKKYKSKTRYTITYIGKVADNETIINKLLSLDYCSYDRRYITDNLYHDVFNLYY